MLTFIVSFVVALLAAGISTWTGFGSATILTPVLVSFLDVRSTILVVAVFHGMANLLKAATFRADIAWGVVMLFAPAAILASVAGGLGSAVAPFPILKVALGALLIFDAATTLGSGRRRDWSSGPLQASIGGACSGFAAGIVGTGGAVRAFFLHHFVTGKTRYVATSAAIAALIDASRVPVYVAEYDDVDLAALVPLLGVTVVAGFAGVFLARALLGKIDADAFRKVVVVSLGLAGIWFVADGIREAL